MRLRYGSTAGFTLVEMLIVMSILSILALMAAVAMHDTTKRAYVAAMQSDLHSLSIAQEAYNETTFSLSGAAAYASQVSDLDLNLSAGVAMVLQANDSGWAARASHSRYPGKQCALFRGTITPLAPATQEGVITCN